jgi:hypothetical protein
MTATSDYDSNHLLDIVKKFLELHLDRDLAARLGSHPSQISRIRQCHSAVTAELLLSMHEETGLAVNQLRALMGDFREHTGSSAKHPSNPGASGDLERIKRR